MKERILDFCQDLDPANIMAGILLGAIGIWIVSIVVGGLGYIALKLFGV